MTPTMLLPKFSLSCALCAASQKPKNVTMGGRLGAVRDPKIPPSPEPPFYKAKMLEES